MLIIFKTKLLGAISKNTELKPLLNSLLSTTVKYVIVEMVPKSSNKTDETMALIEGIISDTELDEDCKVKWDILKRPVLYAVDAENTSRPEDRITARLQDASNAIARNTRTDFENAALLIKPLLAFDHVIHALSGCFPLQEQLESCRQKLVAYFFESIINEYRQLLANQPKYNDLIHQMEKHQATCNSE